MAYFEFWSKGKAVDEKVYKLKSKKDIDSIVSFEIEKICSKLSSSEPGYPIDLGNGQLVECLKTSVDKLYPKPAEKKPKAKVQAASDYPSLGPKPTPSPYPSAPKAGVTAPSAGSTSYPYPSMTPMYGGMGVATSQAAPTSSVQIPAPTPVTATPYYTGHPTTQVNRWGVKFG